MISNFDNKTSECKLKTSKNIINERFNGKNINTVAQQDTNGIVFGLAMTIDIDFIDFEGTIYILEIRNLIDKSAISNLKKKMQLFKETNNSNNSNVKGICIGTYFESEIQKIAKLNDIEIIKGLVN
eukprot:TRINITY_DN2514_c0_g3_i1.p1 TRINITY_DN2514_c0_g3~~TRINITY_DN2514_c0_g3_i1.p1  ORF type:complete len:126 (-),score=50.61 TRINITY_DN2514_c0_g3_i1:46-423(-)